MIDLIASRQLLNSGSKNKFCGISVLELSRSMSFIVSKFVFELLEVSGSNLMGRVILDSINGPLKVM